MTTEFGTLIRKLRAENGFTLEDVAKKCGTHKGYISGIETGATNPPSVKLIRKLARLFRHEERTMVLLAYADKAPALIRDEVRSKLIGTPETKTA